MNNEIYERNLLKYLVNFTKFKYVARDEDGYFWIYEKKPYKRNKPDSIDYGCWICDGEGYGIDSMEPMPLYHNFFQYIKWEDGEPVLIEEALKRYEEIL